MEIVAIISIISVFIWFILAAKNKVNTKDYYEDEAKDKD